METINSIVTLINSINSALTNDEESKLKLLNRIKNLNSEYYQKIFEINFLKKISKSLVKKIIEDFEGLIVDDFILYPIDLKYEFCNNTIYVICDEVLNPLFTIKLDPYSVLKKAIIYENGRIVIIMRSGIEIKNILASFITFFKGYRYNIIYNDSTSKKFAHIPIDLNILNYKLSSRKLIDFFLENNIYMFKIYNPVSMDSGPISFKNATSEDIFTNNFICDENSGDITIIDSNESRFEIIYLLNRLYKICMPVDLINGINIEFNLLMRTTDNVKNIFNVFFLPEDSTNLKQINLTNDGRVLLRFKQLDDEEKSNPLPIKIFNKDSRLLCRIFITDNEMSYSKKNNAILVFFNRYDKLIGYLEMVLNKYNVVIEIDTIFMCSGNVPNLIDVKKCSEFEQILLQDNFKYINFGNVNFSTLTSELFSSLLDNEKRLKNLYFSKKDVYFCNLLDNFLKSNKRKYDDSILFEEDDVEGTGEEINCRVCFRNTNLAISKCYHLLCVVCLKKIVSEKNPFECPICRDKLSHHDFILLR